MLGLVPAAAIPLVFLHSRYQASASFGPVDVYGSDVVIALMLLAAIVAGVLFGWRRLLAVPVKMLDRLIDQHGRLLARAVGAEQGHKGRLAGIGILVQLLAGRFLVALMVEEVVGDLEGEADVASIAAIAGAAFVGDAAHDHRRLDRIFDQRAGLQLLQPGDCLEVERLAFGGEVRARGGTGGLNNSGGAGGSVTLTAGVLEAGGTIDVSGGDEPDCYNINSTQFSGSGGGGRVAIHAGIASGLDPATQLVARGGRRVGCGEPVAYAGPGTILHRTNGQVYGTLRIDNGQNADGSNREAFEQMFDSWVELQAEAHADVDAATWASFRSNMWDGEFLLTASEDDVAGFDTPLLVAMGNDLYHPQSTSRRIAELAPDVTFVETWKDGDALVAFDRTARDFLARHTPA